MENKKMKQIRIGNKLSKCRIDVGEGLETKINLIVGVNHDVDEEIELEKQKIRSAAELGVHTIIDLSIARIDDPLWKWGRENFPKIAFGKVAPILVAVDNDGEVRPADLLREIEWSVKEGIDYMTLNLIPLKLDEFRIAKDRAFPTTSRQGGVLLNYMMKHKVNNPHNPILKDILRLFKDYNVTMHIGSTFRPAGINEAYEY